MDPSFGYVKNGADSAAPGPYRFETGGLYSLCVHSKTPSIFYLRGKMSVTRAQKGAYSVRKEVSRVGLK
jgi:hypothetical protein